MTQIFLDNSLSIGRTPLVQLNRTAQGSQGFWRQIDFDCRGEGDVCSCC